ncbi:MAG: WYL domain-containing protein [Coriobacteriia bacterium]|nr:WYL domain-containing protein [Coriobacteriia bacterium]
MARPNATDRARRLLALLPYLSERRTIPITELARATGSDEATVVADLTTLSVCGSGERGPDECVGVYVDGDSAEVFMALPALERPVRLTADEARALATALESVGIDPGDPLPSRLARLATREPDLEELARTVRSATARGGHAEIVAALSAAAMARRAVRISYYSADRGRESARTIHPYALFVWRGTWYLLAFCEDAGEERTFRVDRITGVKMTPDGFERPEGLPDSPDPLPDLAAMPRAIVRFSSADPDLNEREWPGATFEHRDDGTVIAEVPYAGTSWIARRVAARLGEAEVLEPAEVRRAVAETARSLLSVE